MWGKMTSRGLSAESAAEQSFIVRFRSLMVSPAQTSLFLNSLSLFLMSSLQQQQQQQVPVLRENSVHTVRDQPVNIVQHLAPSAKYVLQDFTKNRA